jgi:hypothetical protein
MLYVDSSTEPRQYGIIQSSLELIQHNIHISKKTAPYKRLYEGVGSPKREFFLPRGDLYIGQYHFSSPKDNTTILLN